MKNNSQKSIVTTIGITLILLAVLSRRLFIHSYSMDAILTFTAGLALILVCFLVLKMIFKNKK